MNGVRLLALALVVGLAMAFPAVALGQPVPDHISRVMVLIDGQPAPDDTGVTAIIDGEDVAMAMTVDGIALLRIPGTGATTGKEIGFMVGDVMAAEKDTWEQGGHVDKEFKISITTYVPVPPHISRLLVSIDGLPAPDGAVVTAWMDGLLAATALTAGGVAYYQDSGGRLGQRQAHQLYYRGLDRGSDRGPGRRRGGLLGAWRAHRQELRHFGLHRAANAGTGLCAADRPPG